MRTLYTVINNLSQILRLLTAFSYMLFQPFPAPGSFPCLCGIALPLRVRGLGPSGPSQLALRDAGEVEAVALLVDEDPHAEEKPIAGFFMAKFEGDALTIFLEYQ